VVVVVVGAIVVVGAVVGGGGVVGVVVGASTGVVVAGCAGAVGPGVVVGVVVVVVVGVADLTVVGDVLDVGCAIVVWGALVGLVVGATAVVSVVAGVTSGAEVVVEGADGSTTGAASSTTSAAAKTSVFCAGAADADASACASIVKSATPPSVDTTVIPDAARRDLYATGFLAVVRAGWPRAASCCKRCSRDSSGISVGVLVDG
jgi:hypothetical protein